MSSPVSHDSPLFGSAEIRRRGSKDLLRVCVLTEVGEEAAEEVQPVGPQSDTEKARPEADPRPPAEYELAWEWKKERIVRTVSGTELLRYIVFTERHVPGYVVFISIRK